MSQKKILLLLLVIALIEKTDQNLLAKNMRKYNPVLTFSEHPVTDPLAKIVFLDPEIRKVNFSRDQVLNLYKYFVNFKAIPTASLIKQNINTKRKTFNTILYFYHFIVKNQYFPKKSIIADMVLTTSSSELAQKILLVADLLLNSSISQQERTRILFQKILILYQNPYMHQKMNAILQRIERKYLSKDRRRLLDLAYNLSLLYHKDYEIRKNALLTLNHLNPYFTKEAYILTQIKVAALKVGLNRYGKKSGKTYKTYKRHLAVVSKLCKSFTLNENEEILAAMIGMWRQDESFSKQWEHPPFTNNCYSSNINYLALQERNALKKWKNKKETAAFDIYRSIIERNADPEKDYLLREKSLAIAEDIYKEDKKGIRLLQTLVDIVKNTPKKNQKNRHIDRIYQVTKHQLDLTDQNEIPYNDIPKIVEIYEDHYINKTKLASINRKYAQVAQNQGDYEKASSLHYWVYQNSKSFTQKKKHLGQSIKLYKQHIKWQDSEIWSYFDKKYHQGYDQLLFLSNKLGPMLDFEQKWKVVKVSGVLLLLKGKYTEAYKLWKSYFSNSRVKKDFSLAFGFLVEKLKTAKKWKMLQETIELTKLIKINPKYRDEKIKVTSYYKKSLLELAKESIYKKDYKTAKEQLTILVKNYHNSEQILEYLHLLIKCERQLQEPNLELSYLNETIKFGFKNKEYHQDLDRAIYLAEGMGRLKDLGRFLISYIKDFPKKSQARKVKGRLEILCQIVDHRECSKYRVETVQDRGFSNIKRSASEEKIINILQKAKIAFKQQDQTQLRQFEQDLFNMEQNYPLVSDALSKIWFFQIKIISDGLRKQISNLSKNPRELLKRYKNIKQAFLGMCYRPNIGHCVEGVRELQQLASFINSNIKKYISLKPLGHFISQEEQKLKEKIHQSLLENETSPEIVKNILWESKGDWNFTNTVGLGVGYIQMPISLNKQ